MPSLSPLCLACCLLLSSFVAAAPPPLLKAETLSQLPPKLCTFSFANLRKWRVLGTPPAPGCTETDVRLRYLDGKTYRHMVVDEIGDETDELQETTTTDPRPGVSLSLLSGSLDTQEEIDLPSNVYGATLRRSEGSWKTSSMQGESDAHLRKSANLWVLNGEITSRMYFDSGHYCCSGESEYWIVDDRHGHLLFVEGEAELVHKLLLLPAALQVTGDTPQP